MSQEERARERIQGAGEVPDYSAFFDEEFRNGRSSPSRPETDWGAVGSVQSHALIAAESTRAILHEHGVACVMHVEPFVRLSQAGHWVVNLAVDPAFRATAFEIACREYDRLSPLFPPNVFGKLGGDEGQLAIHSNLVVSEGAPPCCSHASPGRIRFPAPRTGKFGTRATGAAVAAQERHLQAHLDRPDYEARARDQRRIDEDDGDGDA